MNERVSVEFSVSQIGFRRAATTFTARVEIVWGIQALPFVMEEEIVGTESAEYLAAAEELACSQACQNPFYAMDNPDTCDAPTVTSLRIEPATVRAGQGTAAERLARLERVVGHLCKLTFQA